MTASASPPLDPLSFLAEREAVAAAMRKIYALRLTTASGGNISLRLPGDRCAITPGGGDKAATAAAQIAVVSLAGENLIPGVRPSSEFRMHLAIYRRCPRVKAIVHAHPPTASAFTAAATPILADLTAEAYAILRRIAVVPYALTGTEALGELCADAACGANCLLLENHGATTLGATLYEAFNRLEVLEAAAWHTWITSSLDRPRRLTAEQIRELEALYGPDIAGD